MYLLGARAQATILKYPGTKFTKVFVLGLTNCSFGTQIWEIWIRDGSSSWPVLSGGLLRALVDLVLVQGYMLLLKIC